jgi:tetratricopeptide (TPR) repeat protein
VADFLAPALAAVVVIVIYGAIACTEDAELGSRTPAEDYYNRLIDGFAKGQVSLDLAAPAGLARLADPYDPRQNAPFHGQAYLPGRFHDLSYYQGKLYLYFSAVPAVILFLPFHELTGAYLSHQQACFVFCSMGFLAGAALIDSIRRVSFPSAGAVIATVCTLCVGLVPVVPIVLQRPEVWEVPITAAYAFWMISLLLLWIYLRRRAPSWGIALGLGAAVGLAIGCRPNGALGAAILLVPFLRAIRLNRLAAVAALVLPLAAVAAGLFAYNAARFGSVFDFGQRYQLTGDVERPIPHFLPGFFWYNVQLYFFTDPGWQPAFPFVVDLVPPPQPAGHVVVENPVGALTLLPFLLCAAAIPLGLRQQPEGERRLLAVMVGTLLLLFVSGAGPLGFFFATCVRYQLEFIPALALLAAIGFLGLRASFPQLRPVRWGLLGVSGAAAAVSIAFNLLMAANLRGVAETRHGVAAMQSGHLDQAADLFRRAAKLRPASPSPYIGLSKVLAEQGKLPEAAAEFKEAILLLPNSAELHLNYAYCLFRMGRLDEAKAECATALELRPGFSAAVDLEREIGEHLRRNP